MKILSWFCVILTDVYASFLFQRWMETQTRWKENIPFLNCIFKVLFRNDRCSLWLFKSLFTLLSFRFLRVIRQPQWNHLHQNAVVLLFFWMSHPCPFVRRSLFPPKRLENQRRAGEWTWKLIDFPARNLSPPPTLSSDLPGNHINPPWIYGLR